MYQKKFICLKQEDLVLWGDFASEESRQFNIDFVKCNTTEHDDCKTDKQVEEYVRDKYLLILSNQVKFVNSQYGEKSVVPRTNLQWSRFNSQMKVTLPFKVTQTSLDLQDLLLDLD